MGPNYVLDKGYVVQGTALGQFECVKGGTTNTSVTRCDTAAEFVLGVSQELLDAAKVLTGKATADVRILGISRVVASAAIARMAKVTVTTVGRAVTAGVAGTNCFGIALTPASANGDWIDVLLTPGNTV